MKTLYTIISLLAFYFVCYTPIYAQEEDEKVLIKTVLDTTFTVGMLGTVEIPYTFAQDDEILFSFVEKNGNTLSLLQIQQPSAELNMQAKQVTSIEDKFINISEEGEHILRFKQNPYFGIGTFKKLDCQVLIKKIVPVKDFVVVDTTYLPQPKKLVKVDSVYQTFLDTVVYVASELNVNNSDRTSLPVILPPETNYWGYWMGVEKAAIDNYNSYEQLVIEDWQEANISTAIEGFILGNITYFPINQQGESATYFFADEQNKTRFEQKKGYSKFSYIKSGQQIRADYTKMRKSGIQDTMYMCFLNRNNISGVNVHVKMGALKLSYEYEEQEDSMVITQKSLSINTDVMSIEAARDSIEQLKLDLTDAAKKIEEDYNTALAALDSTKAANLAQLDVTQKGLEAEEQNLTEREAALEDSKATSKEDYVKEVFVLRDKLSKAEKELEALKNDGDGKGKKKKGKKKDTKTKQENTQEKQSKTPPSKSDEDKLYVGGDLGFSFTNRAFDLRLSPFIAYYFLPKLSLALGPKVEYHKEINKDALFSYGGRAFLRYDVAQNLFAHVEFEAVNRAMGSGDEVQRQWELGLPIGGGYRQKIGEYTYLNITFLFDVLNPGSTNGRSPLSYRGGVTYDLGNIGKGAASKIKKPELPSGF